MLEKFTSGAFGSCSRSYLQVAQLCELLVAIFEATGKGFNTLVHDTVGANISSLSEAFMAFIAFKRFLASVSTLVGLDKAVSGVFSLGRRL